MWTITTRENLALAESHPARWTYNEWETVDSGIRYWWTGCGGFVSEEDALEDARRCIDHYLIRCEHEPTHRAYLVAQQEGAPGVPVYDASAHITVYEPKES